MKYVLSHLNQVLQIKIAHFVSASSLRERMKEWVPERETGKGGEIEKLH